MLCLYRYWKGVDIASASVGIGDDAYTSVGRRDTNDASAGEGGVDMS